MLCKYIRNPGGFICRLGRVYGLLIGMTGFRNSKVREERRNKITDLFLLLNIIIFFMLFNKGFLNMFTIFSIWFAL